MRNNPGKKAALIFTLVLLLTPLFWIQCMSEAMAATPSFKEKEVEIIGVGETYQLDIVNKVDGSKYKWSSSNTKVARVSSKGLVTSAGKGSATIRCVITYPNKKTKTLKCKVTVTVPATKIVINNANDEYNKPHVMKVGETYNFNRDIFPSNSSYKTYWYVSDVGGSEPECIKVNSSNGIVEAVKPGYAVLTAAAVKTASYEEALNSKINDAVIIQIVEPTASVTYAEITDSTQLKVVFDSPIDASTVIGSNNALLDSIVITLKKNAKGVSASDPGNLTASLSEDKKTLIITASNQFEGEYIISFTNKIKTTDGIALNEYYKLIKYTDTIPPAILNCTLDDTGFIMTIEFNEPVDFTDLRVSNATVVAVLPGSSTTTTTMPTYTMDPTTALILNNRSNYIPSEDKRSLTIDLSKIASTDYNKIFSVAISGIKDLTGNAPANSYLVANLRTDTSTKPQAKLINVVRTGYYTLTATFDRAILTGGYATIQNGSSYMVGVVDSKNPKRVNYTMNDSDALKTGTQTVIITGWNSYNVDPKDTASYQQHTRSVNFTVDQTNPVLLKEEYDAKTSTLTLTYNKEVTLSFNTGSFVARLVTVNDEIRSNIITYTMLNSDDAKVIKLKLTNMTYYGYYTFTLDKNFVVDNFKNGSLERTITVNNIEGVDMELPGPYRITQSTTNLNLIYLDFANMLDAASAQNVSNYSIPGVTILSAKLEKNTKDEGATVVLTVADGSIDISIERPIRISGVKSYSGLYGPISDYSATVYLKENKKPYYVSTIYDKNYPSEVRLRFSEQITGTMSVRVVNQSGTYYYEIGNTVTVSGTDVIITLSGAPKRNALLRIEILENNIRDLSGNETAPMNTQYYVVAQY